MRKLVLVLLAGIMLLTGCGGGEAEALQNGAVNSADVNQSPGQEDPAAEPDTVRLGLFPYSSYAPLYYAIVEGYFEEQNIEIELIDFTRQSDAVVALASRQIDVSGGVLDVATLAAIGEGTGLKIVADKGYIDPNADCPYGAWMVRTEILESGGLDEIENIVGMKVVLTKAGFFEFAMDKLLEPNNLSTADLEIIEMPAPSRLEAFETNAIDIASVGEPWITRTLSTGFADIWEPFETNHPNAQYAVIWYGPSIILDNPEIGKRFMTAYLKAVQQYNLGKTERNITLMAEFTNTTAEEVEQSCWQAFTPDASVNLDFIIEFQRWAIEKGYLDKELETADFWDGRFLEYAHDNLP